MSTSLRRALIVFGCLTAIVASWCSQAPAQVRADAIVSPGEELTYDVRWFTLHLGRIRITAQAPTSERGATVYHSTAAIDSYEGLPFVNVHARDRSDMDSLLFSLAFRAMEKKDEQWREETSRYDFSRRILIIERAAHATLTSPRLAPATFDTVFLPSTHVQDGLSIFSFARLHMRDRAEVVVPTVVYGKLGTTRFRFNQVPEAIEIDAIDGKKVRTIPFEGKLDITGIFGLTGDFKGWFSDDAAAVPIKAEMKVLLGSVTIELTHWFRRAWQPPTEK